MDVIGSVLGVLDQNIYRAISNSLTLERDSSVQ